MENDSFCPSTGGPHGPCGHELEEIEFYPFIYDEEKKGYNGQDETKPKIKAKCYCPKCKCSYI